MGNIEAERPTSNETLAAADVYRTARIEGVRLFENPFDDPILQRIRHSLRAMYGHRLERLVLFGSRARGEAHPDSDYDIAVFLDDLTDRWREFRRLAELRTEILVETDAFLEARPFRAGSYRDRTPLMHEIRRDGIDL